MFEKATRLKFRFDSPQGCLTTEDLWDLPLTGTDRRANLDDIARTLNRELKQNEGELSFVRPPEPKGDELQTKFELVKHIITVKMAERDAALEAQAKIQKKQQILAIIARKQDAELEGASVDDLQKMLAEL